METSCLNLNLANGLKRGKNKKIELLVLEAGYKILIINAGSVLHTERYWLTNPRNERCFGFHSYIPYITSISWAETIMSLDMQSVVPVWDIGGTSLGHRWYQSGT